MDLLITDLNSAPAPLSGSELSFLSMI